MLTRAEIKALHNAASVALASDEGGDFGEGKRYERMMAAMQSAQEKLRHLQTNQQTALRLLRDAQHAIYSELVCCGSDEIKQNPNLRSRDRLHDRITKYLNQQGGSDT